MFFMIDMTDVLAVLFLVFMEGVLSMDNALVLALMVRHLPPAQRKRALTYGIWGAFAFRFISLFFLTHLMELAWIKWVGGGYLIYLAVKNLFFPEEQVDRTSKVTTFGFWKVIVMVELMDIAFSVDSILAAVSLSQNYWVVLTGGILGIIMMRFAATIFVKLVNAFPKMNQTAYLLVFTIGTKLFLQGFNFPWLDFHSAKNPASWIFWFTMIGCVVLGLKRSKKGDSYEPKMSVL